MNFVIFARAFFLTFVLSFLLTGGLAFAVEPLKDLSLEQCYRLALAQSEKIAIQKQVMLEAQGRFYQALSGILPRISFLDTEKYQDQRKDSYTPQRQFVFSQPLFSGFKEFAAMAASRAEHKQRDQELVRAKQLLFTDVSDAFFLFKRYDEEYKTVEDIHQALQEHVDELKKREALGRSRGSEVASTEARLFQSEADLQAVAGQRDLAGQLLDFLVGKHVLSLGGEDFVSDNTVMEPDYVRAAGRRPDVIAADEAYHAAEKQITVARSGYFPKVSAEGNSYITRGGTDSGNNWDASVVVSVPLFNGTETRGLIKEARAKKDEAKISRAETLRAAVLDIQNAYTTFVSSRKQSEAYKKTVDASLKSYDLQKQDYQKNLVSNLDVLQALQDWQAARRNYIAVQTDAGRAYWRLKVSLGEISP